MKQVYMLFIGALLLCGCVTSSSLGVISKKQTEKPFSKLLVIYLDEACDFSPFDSTTYNICLRRCFIDTENLFVRDRVEDILATNLNTHHTTAIKSTELFNVATNSYEAFQKGISQYAIDGILIVDFRNYSATRYPGMPALGNMPGRAPSRTTDETFYCTLLTTAPYVPVWTARFNLKGNTYSNKTSLKYSMARQLAKNLGTSGYIYK